MNAYELADALKDDWADKFRFDAANMLRQQADRIAELEKKLQESALDYISVCSQADEHYARVKELEKLLEHSIGSDCREMRYIQEIENKDTRIAALEKEKDRLEKLVHQRFDDGKRLGILDTELKYKFAPQTKPLTEKELYEVFDKCYPNNGDGDVVTLVDFARAIEERHGIK